MTIPSLSDELVLMVCEQTLELHPQSILNLCLVSWRFCRLASTWLYRSIIIPRSRKWRLDCNWDLTRQRYSIANNIMTYTRHITVEHDLEWSSFSILLSKMHRLESIRWRYWEAPFPTQVRTVLHKYWPDAKLYIEKLSIGHRTDEVDVQQKDLDLLKSVVGCYNIHSLDVQNNYDHPVTMRWLKDVLLGSKRLEIMRITLPRFGDGRVEWSCDNLGSYDLCAEPGETLGSLTELVYEARVPYAVDDCFIPVSFFDWSKIRHLELRGHRMYRFVESLKDHVLRLDTLIIEFFCRGEMYDNGLHMLDDLVSRVRGLKKLQLVNPVNQFPVSTISVHGDTLKDLNIRHPRHGNEPYSMVIQAQPYLPESLDSLQQSCPHLCSLTLDMMIIRWLPYDTLAALARFRNLSVLRLFLCFNYTLYGPPKALPHITSDRLIARHIFSYLRNKKAGAQLDRVEIMMGDSPRIPYYQGPRDVWERPNIFFVCREDANGNFVVEDDVHEDEAPSWAGYFGMQRLESHPGETYPHNLQEILDAEE